MSPGQQDANGETEEDEEEIVDYENLRPTYTHEALSLLTDKGLLRYMVSQNCDGLHLLSGIPPEKISELHGNVFVEKCPKCGVRYTRNFYTLSDEASQYYEDLEDCGRTELQKPKFAQQCVLCGLCHRTGRVCQTKVPRSLSLSHATKLIAE
jgi:mono-ADP-ribosyltransferase sirtuin 6